MLYYLHIPKSAGTSVRRLFGSVYGSRLVEVYQDISTSYTRTLLETCNENSVLFGHFCFGLHELLHDPKPTYLTLVRHPVERVVSWFKHQLRDANSRFHQPLHRQELTLRDIVERGLAPEVNNHSVRMICASYRRLPLYRARDIASRCFLGKQYHQFNAERHLTGAFRHIEKSFAFIATVDQQSRLVDLLAEENKLSADSLKIPTENTSPTDLEVQIDAVTRDAISRANRLDLKLYESLM